MKQLLSALLLFVGVACAQEAITIKMDVSCTTRFGPGSFAVQSWSFGANNAINLGSAMPGSGKPSLANLTVVKQMDECSTQLFALAVQGKHSPKLTLTQTDSSGKTTLMTVELDTAFVSSYQVSGNTGNAAPGETVTFAFAKITIAYYGSGGPRTTFSWDVTKNAGN